jgi:hypothetical protein
MQHLAVDAGGFRQDDVVTLLVAISLKRSGGTSQILKPQVQILPIDKVGSRLEMVCGLKVVHIEFTALCTRGSWAATQAVGNLVQFASQVFCRRKASVLSILSFG